jgi:hypothetical protein
MLHALTPRIDGEVAEDSCGRMAVEANARLHHGVVRGPAITERGTLISMLGDHSRVEML